MTGKLKTVTVILQTNFCGKKNKPKIKSKIKWR